MARLEKNFSEQRERAQARAELLGEPPKPKEKKALGKAGDGNAVFTAPEPSSNSYESSFDSAASRVNFWKEVAPAEGEM